MFSTRRVKTSFSLVLLFVAIAATLATAAPQSNSNTPQLQAAPRDAQSHGDSTDDGGSISSPSTGTDAKSIIAASARSMGTSADSTNDDDVKDPHAGNFTAMGGHNGQCVTSCAIKSTDGVGCGKDLSKPDCFCNSENFIDQTFACINATCPQQFHGAAGVISSICSVAGAPGLKIPGYNNTGNLENMPTINDDGNNNGTNSTNPSATSTGRDSPGAGPGSQNGGGITSTFSMPVSIQTSTPSANGPGAVSNGSNPAGNSSNAAVGRCDADGVVALAASVAAMLTSFGIWTLV